MRTGLIFILLSMLFIACSDDEKDDGKTVVNAIELYRYQSVIDFAEYNNLEGDYFDIDYNQINGFLRGFFPEGYVLNGIVTWGNKTYKATITFNTDENGDKIYLIEGENNITHTIINNNPIELSTQIKNEIWVDSKHVTREYFKRIIFTGSSKQTFPINYFDFSVYKWEEDKIYLD